jgi:hypothetical protein
VLALIGEGRRGGRGRTRHLTRATPQRNGRGVSPPWNVGFRVRRAGGPKWE